MISATGTQAGGDVRELYLDAAAVAVELIADPRLASRWEEPSACAEWPVGGLAAHLVNQLCQLGTYLDGEAARGVPVSAGAYYAALDGVDDPGSDLSSGIRDKSSQAAAAGPEALAKQARLSLADLGQRLPTEPVDRCIQARGIPMVLGEYLRTRLVEICVHVEDMAMSVDVPVPDLPDGAVREAVDVLVDTAVHRHGSPTVLRALTRRERDAVNALQVL